MIQLAPQSLKRETYTWGNVEWAPLTDIKGVFVRFTSPASGGNFSLRHHLEKEPLIILQAIKNGSITVVSKDEVGLTLTASVNDEEYILLIF